MKIDERVAGYLGRVLDNAGTVVGTCFQIIDSIAATAFHVLADAGAGNIHDNLRIDPLQGGEAVDAEVLAIDVEHDLAIVRLADPLPECNSRLAATDQVQLTVPDSVTGVPS